MEVIVVVGAGSIGKGIARRVSAGKKVLSSRTYGKRTLMRRPSGFNAMDV